MKRTKALLKPLGALLVTALVVAPALMAGTWREAVADGGFELGTPNSFWNEYSQHAGVVIWQDGTRAHTGEWYASFGSDYPVPETAWLSQDILLGTGAATISFWWTRPFESENNEDVITLSIDGSVVWVDQPYPGIGPLDIWIQETFDISSFADGGSHQILFEMSSTGTSNSNNGTLWFVDDVEVQTQDGEPLQADFYWEPDNPSLGQQIQFWNTTLGGADQWFWDFGDGQTSELKDPIHVYFDQGEYPVTLTAARSGTGEQSLKTHTVIIGQEPLSVDFSWQPPDPLPGQTVVFFPDLAGGPDSLIWDFGDGTTSEEINPQHIFEAPGQYVVSLEIFRSSDEASGRMEHTVWVLEPLFPEFTWTPEVPGIGEIVTLTDLSTGEPEWWAWDFGDGGASEEQHPTHAWEAAGNYDVTLTIARTDGLDTSVTHTVTVSDDQMTAAFTWDPPEPSVDETVWFSDLSTGEPVEWSWNFGDGATSAEQSPTHAYADSGSFDVTMIVTDSAGVSAEISRVLYVSDDPYLADFSWVPEEPHAGQAVEFFDQSLGDPVAWKWEFGDGRMSRQQDPVHWYDGPGHFDVTLTVAFDPEGTILRSTTRTVVIAPPPLEADFFWIPLTPTTGEFVEFTDVSRGRPTAWLWQFGDGTTSENQHPGHAFDAPGQYTVILTIERQDGKALVSDTVERTIHVTSDIEINFSWEPEQPRALAPIQFIEEIGGVGEPVGGRFWAFGDSETSHDENPSHTYHRAGAYLVQFWIGDGDGNIIATAEHEVTVLPADLDLELVVSNPTPDIGEAVTFHLSGIDVIEGAQWAFGGIGCDGSDGHRTCIPSEEDDCTAATFTYATPGLKPARIWIVAASGIEMGPFAVAVQVGPEGQCSEPPLADFRWWPVSPKAGEQVRCVDLSVGPPETWAWTFDDGSTSETQHATHIFETPGEHLVELAITNDQGQSTVTRTITIGTADAVCGNDICEPGETSWSCSQDCFEDPEGTGRGGRKNTNLMVPAAVGGIHGANGTYWVTEGSIVNPGDEDAQVVVEFVAANDPGTPRVAGPTTIPPRTAVHFDNVVWQLFGTHASGSLWIDADKPVIANTRTFNRVGDATFGQGIGGITKNDVLGEGDGSVFIVGLKHNDRFRTNFLFQEVSGRQATVVAEIFDASGTSIAAGSIPVPAKTKWQKPISDLGITSLEAGYAVLRVTGQGKIAAMASVIDQVTGDATSLDSVHTLQTGAGGPAKADDEESSHFLVAVVARTPGSNDTVWRSEISILNSDETDQILELRYLPSDGEMMTATRELAAGELFFSEDVIEDVFPDAANGAGSLHVYAQKGLVVNSRTYNVLPDESTVGQAIPGLAGGDMARPGEVWLLDSLKQTEDFRCNLGFAEFEGSDAEVTVVLFDTDGASLFFLASKKYSVPAFSQFQVNKVFKDMGLTGNFREAIAYVSVASEGGALYVYASVVDNAKGDGTTILGKRQ